MGLKEDLKLNNEVDNLNHEAILTLYFTSLLIKKRSYEFFKKFGLTDVQYNVMVLLYYQKSNNEGLTQVELSKMMLVNKANITTLVDRMEKSDLVKRQNIKGDRRYNMITLTEKGLKLFQEIEVYYFKEIDKVINILEKDEIHKLMDICNKLRSRLL